MIGKEILDYDSKAELTENKFTEITADRTSIEDTKSYWNRIFDVEKEWISEEELWEKMLYCEESEFEFSDVVDEKTKRVIESFDNVHWETLDDEGRLKLIKQLANCIGESLGIKKLPEIELVELEEECFGYYSERGNYIAINTSYWDNPMEVVDTIAHEMRHAYQRYRADLCENAQDKLYKFNYEHYISPERDVDGKYVNFFDYYLQYIEVEARAYAKEFTREVA